MGNPDAYLTRNDDWNPQHVIEWLSHEGRKLKCIELLMTRLSEQLQMQKIPLIRMRISLPTLNPQVFRRSYTWWIDKEKIETYSAPHSITHSSDYIGSPIQAIQATEEPYHRQLAECDYDSLHPVLQTLVDNGATDYLVIPIRFTFEEKVSPWILTTDHLQGFSAADIEKYIQVSHYLAPLLEVLALHLTTQSLLETYLGVRTGQKVLNGKIQRGDGELIEAVIWYSDMRDSTAIAESLNHQQLLHILNCYFEAISDSVTQQGGEVLRFIGDAMLVVFTGDQYPSLAEAAKAALKAAEHAHQQITLVNEKLQQQNLPTIRYGLGLDVGSVIYGNVGASNRLDFTVMGSAVNRAARIENLTKIANCSLLVSEQLASLLDDEFCWKGAYPVAGLPQPLSVYCAKCEFQE
ncbi:MAG: adenylate/guanylate cyclase domain-containing protein [Motiliproteus sp.]